MLSNFDRNMGVIRRRWPSVARELEAVKVAHVQWQDGPKDGTLVYKGIRMTGAVDRMADARVQAGTVAAGSDVQWCFGIGLGELPRELIRRNRKTAVIVMNREFARASLEQVYHADWLEHKKVNFGLAADIAASIRVPDNAPFTVVPMELRHCDPDAYPVRDAVCGAINSRFNYGIQYKAQLTNDLAHWEANKARMEGIDKPVPELFDTRKGCDAIVCASGPTLDDQLEWLHANRDGKLLICLNSSLKPLRSAGIMPDYCVVIDSADSIAKGLDGLEVDSLAQCVLIYEPVVTPAFIESWPGERRFSVNNWLWSKGTVMHAAVDLAAKMGAASITLLGVDLCHPRLKSHAKDAPDHYDVKTEIPAAMIPTIDGNGNETYTIPCHAMYHRHLESYIKDHPQIRFYKRGREGVPVMGAAWME